MTGGNMDRPGQSGGARRFDIADIVADGPRAVEIKAECVGQHLRHTSAGLAPKGVVLAPVGSEIRVERARRDAVDPGFVVREAPVNFAFNGPVIAPLIELPGQPGLIGRHGDRHTLAIGDLDERGGAGQ